MTGRSDQVASIWDVATGRELREVRADTREPVHGNAFPVAFTSDGAWVVTADPVTLWDVATGKKSREFPGDTAAVSPDGRLVAAGWDAADRRGAVRPYETDGGKVVATLRGLPEGRRSAPPFRPTARRWRRAAWARVVLWEVASGAEVSRRPATRGGASRRSASPRTAAG